MPSARRVNLFSPSEVFRYLDGRHINVFLELGGAVEKNEVHGQVARGLPKAELDAAVFAREPCPHLLQKSIDHNIHGYLAKQQERRTAVALANCLPTRDIFGRHGHRHGMLPLRRLARPQLRKAIRPVLRHIVGAHGHASDGVFAQLQIEEGNGTAFEFASLLHARQEGLHAKDGVRAGDHVLGVLGEDVRERPDFLQQTRGQVQAGRHRRHSHGGRWSAHGEQGMRRMLKKC